MLLLTLPVLVAALFLQGKFSGQPALASTLYGLVFLSACSAIVFPPDSGDFVKYTNAFLSASLIIRAVELLLVQDPGQLKHLERVSHSRYAWEPISRSLGLRRLLQVSDLVTNPRAVGWSHSSPKYLPPLRQVDPVEVNGWHSPDHRHRDHHHPVVLVATADRLPFLTAQLCRAVVAYVFIDTYQATFARHYPDVCHGVQALLVTIGLPIHASAVNSEMLVRRYLLPPACWMTSYAFVDGIHAAGAIFSVGILPFLAPSLAGDPWMHPPVFGPLRYMLTFSLRDIWGKMWHDLCRRPFLALTLAIIPSAFPLPLKRFLVICLSFAVSGLVHSAGTYAVSHDWTAVAMMMLFFGVLPLCIAAQQILSEQLLPRLLPAGSVAKFLIWLLDGAFVMAWGYHTSPWFIKHSKLPEAMASIPLPVSLWGLVVGA
ncbi:hypothetical protein BO70DRAFT_99266 [Aspergillus heteromorphus CBS 117.55]|uniref:Wax synthase domain-containing protein n=1 Tax=Aspergillus heteromorphus CBS 117.55 TaxID=1448321 RepID=A0A317VQ51_9EURO|nr:uncharacterized protein BO70DRAFT_99266 [Aspergillus heteromorphus CBS 117.55]PWY74992.1 hypothetical protein BO70DRAFT_99266 [Aspergillus heteromorphus CBS 117.55]